MGYRRSSRTFTDSSRKTSSFYRSRRSSRLSQAFQACTFRSSPCCMIPQGHLEITADHYGPPFYTKIFVAVCQLWTYNQKMMNETATLYRNKLIHGLYI